jgi:hypothetical protein
MTETPFAGEVVGEDGEHLLEIHIGSWGMQLTAEAARELRDVCNRFLEGLPSGEGLAKGGAVDQQN